VALFISTQSGDWHDPMTWDVGSVPDLDVDDVIIANGHEVIFEADQYESLGPGHLLGIAPEGTLRIQGGIDACDSSVIVLGVLLVEDDYLAVWGGAELIVDSAGTLTIAGGFYLTSDATADIWGQMTIESGAWADIYNYATLTVEVGGTIQNYGYCYIEWDGQAVIRDDFSIESGGYLDLYDYSVLSIDEEGATFIYGTLYIYYYSRIEVFGYFGLAQDGWLYLDYKGLINAYKDIRIGGRAYGYGGEIAMLRREGRILDFNDNPVFVLDRAYGFGQARIA
jgi:hypothetical protein